MVWYRLLINLLAALSVPFAEANDIKVLFLQNRLQSNGWKEGFYDFFVPFLDGAGGLTVGNAKYRLNVSVCEENLDASVEAIGTTLQRCIDSDVDVMVVGSSQYNNQIKDAAQEQQIPNLHCSGGSIPLSWTSSPYAFGLELSITLYSQQVIRQAAFRRLTSAVIIRNVDSEVQKVSAVSSSEWIRESRGIQLVGPSVSWCNRWAAQTKSCSIRNNQCRCGSQSEFDAFGYKYNITSEPSFYEVSESDVVEAGFNSTGDIISIALMAFVEGIIEDVRSQGVDPDVVLNLLTAARSGLAAMRNKRFKYQMYYGGPNSPGRAWNGYESFFPNGTVAFGKAEAMYNLGAGQWHPELRFSDPIFGSSETMVQGYKSQFGKVPSSDSASCVAAGVSLAHSLEKYGQSLMGNISQRREEIRMALGQLQDETFFGRIHFDRKNQNIGRLPITWQVLEDGNDRPVFPPELVVDDFRFPSPDWSVRLGCPAGTYAAGSMLPTECTPCQEGTFRSTPTAPLEFSQCEECGQGRGTLPGVRGQSECLPCPGGTFQNGNSDQGICKPCPLGTFRNASSSSSEGCLPCQAHTFADVPGLDACKACPSLASQPRPGQGWCLCDIGSYKDPSDTATEGATLSCLPCENTLPGSTTLHLNSKQQEDCVCPPESFWHRPSPNSPVAICKECGLGLKCKGGFEAGSAGKHQAPLQTRGFHAGAAAYPGGDPSYIISCSDNLRCPGELPLGECPPNAFGIACTACMPGYFDSEGLCESCSEPFDPWPLVVAFSVVVVVFAGLYVFATKFDKSHRDCLTIILVSHMLGFINIYSLPIFSKLDVQLVEPLRSLRRIFLTLALDINLVRPGCWLGGHDPLMQYLGALGCYPAGSVCLLLLFVMNKYCLKKKENKDAWYHVRYAHGMIMMALYTLLTSITMRPWRCIENPDESSSLGYSRDIICWQDDTHFSMVALSVVSFFGLVVSFMVLMCVMVFQYPVKLRRQGGAKFVKRWQFIFGHCTAKRYYFVLLFILRNFLLGVLPAIFISRVSLLILSLAATMGMYSLIQVKLWPWKTQIANIVDAGFSLVLMLVMLLATTLLQFDVAREVLLIQIVAMILLSLILLGAMVALIFSTYRAYKPTKAYGIFLSHHKMGAGSLARWFKIMLAQWIKDRIFLDSDDVNKLDAIMDVTAYDSGNVVVLITSETLKRMWCAAEISSAYHAGTNIVLVSCDGNELDEELISWLPRLWNEEQEATLVGAGVTIQMIESAYRALLKDNGAVSLDRRGAMEKFHFNAVQQVVGLCQGLKKRKFTSMRHTVMGRRDSYGAGVPFMMLSDLQSPENGSCARVISYLLRNYLQEEVALHDPCTVVSDLETFKEEMQGALAILVLLTQGMLHDWSFAGVLAACPQQSRDGLIPIRADEFFVYPDPGFWENLAEGKVFDGQTLAGMDTDFEGVRAAYAKLFNVLALKFSQHGSESIQKTEIAMISARLQAFLSNPALQSIASGEQPVSRVGTSTSTNGASIQSMTGFDSPDMFPPPKERETFEKWQELDLSCRTGTAVITSTDSLPINIVQEEL